MIREVELLEYSAVVWVLYKQFRMSLLRGSSLCLMCNVDG